MIRKISGKEVDINSLTPHPKNVEIYGDEDVSDLVENIKRFGLRMQLVITESNVIIAGHRRFKACKELGFKTVPVDIVKYETPDEEIEDLINLNLTRDRTDLQKAKEAATLIDIEKKKADIRKRAGEKIDLLPNSAEGLEKGNARDKVAERVGFKSGHEAERAMKAAKKIDELNLRGDDESKEKAELIKGVLNNRSVSSAEELARCIDTVKIDDNKKEDVKSGKISPMRFIDIAKQKEKTINNKTALSKEIQESRDEVAAIVDEFNAQSRGEIEVYIPLAESNILIGNLRTAVIDFKREIAQVAAHEIEINNFNEEEKALIKQTLNDFQNYFNQIKTHIIKE